MPTRYSAPIDGIQACRSTSCRPAALESKLRHKVSATKAVIAVEPERESARLIRGARANEKRAEERNENERRDHAEPCVKQKQREHAERDRAEVKLDLPGMQRGQQATEAARAAALVIARGIDARVRRNLSLGCRTNSPSPPNARTSPSQK